MQLLLTTKRHFTIALWMPVRLSSTTPGIFGRMRRSVMRRVEACNESHGGYFVHLLLMCSFRYNSQIKCFRRHVDTDIFSCFGMWNSCPKSVRNFQLHPVYKILSGWFVRSSMPNISSEHYYKLRVAVCPSVCMSVLESIIHLNMIHMNW
jgi:hypothetical protein